MKNVSGIIKKVMYFFSFQKKLRLFLLSGVLLALISQICLIVNSYVYRYFIDVVIIGQKSSYLNSTLVSYGVLFLISNIIDYIVYKRNLDLSSKAVEKARNSVLDQYLRYGIPNDFSECRKVLLDEIPLLYEFIDKILMVILVNSLAAVICFAAMLNYSIILALVCTLTIPMAHLLNRWVLKGEKRANEAIRQNDKDTESFLSNMIENSGQISILDDDLRNTKEIFDIYKEKNRKLQLKYAIYNITRFRVIPLIKNELIMQLLVYITGGFLILTGRIAIGTLLGFAVLFHLFQKNLNDVLQAFMDIQANSVHYSAILDNFNNMRPNQGSITIDHVDSLTFHDLGLSVGSRILFEKINRSISAGDHVIITGESGIGKSTLLRSILGLHNQYGGSVLINRAHISDINPSCLYERIGALLQTSRLFTGTIKENLLYAKNDAVREDLDNACKRAGLLEFIENSENGYDTFIGANGSLLSGGQRQRLLLARLFMNDYDLLLLDEPTSALDKDTKQAVLDNLMEYGKNKTIIIVSHDTFEGCYDFKYWDLNE